MRRGLVVFVATLVGVTDTALAQSKEPIGRFVADFRAASSGLPVDPGWTPLVPATTIVPSRGLGIDAGAHVYLLRMRMLAIGVGANWLKAGATSSPPEPAQTPSTPPPPSTIPDVTTRVTSFAPQLSLNFGHSLGWSYVSAGLGQAKVESEAALAGSATQFTPRQSGWVKTLNYGGGARWFINDHVGVGFDLRWYKLSLIVGDNTRPSAPRASLFVAGGGVVVK